MGFVTLVSPSVLFCIGGCNAGHLNNSASLEIW